MKFQNLTYSSIVDESGTVSEDQDTICWVNDDAAAGSIPRGHRYYECCKTALDAGETEVSCNEID